MKIPVLVAASGICLVGCSHAPAPTEQVASSLAAVRAAEVAGAAKIPEAELHMKMARDQLEDARELMSKEEFAEARDKAARARQDAELALSLTHEHEARSQFEQLQQAQSTAGGEQRLPRGGM